MKQQVDVKRGESRGAIIIYFRASSLKNAHRAIEMIDEDPMEGFRLHVSKITRQSKRGGRGQRVQLVLYPTCFEAGELDLAVVESEIGAREGRIALGEEIAA